MCLETSVEDNSVRVVPSIFLKQGQRRSAIANLVRLRDLTQMFEGIEVRDDSHWNELGGAFPQKLGLGGSGIPDIIGSERLWA